MVRVNSRERQLNRTTIPTPWCVILVSTLDLLERLKDSAVLEIGLVVCLVLLADVDLLLECSLSRAKDHLLLSWSTVIWAPADRDERTLDTTILGVVVEVDDGEAWTISAGERLDELWPYRILKGGSDSGITLCLEVSIAIGGIWHNRHTLNLEGGKEVLSVVLAKILDGGESLGGWGDTRLEGSGGREREERKKEEKEVGRQNREGTHVYICEAHCCALHVCRCSPHGGGECRVGSRVARDRRAPTNAAREARTGSRNHHSHMCRGGWKEYIPVVVLCVIVVC